MIMYRNFILIFLILVSVCDVAKSKPDCYFEHYSAEDGLPQGVVSDMFQDKKGFMWFATWNGICKFDGYRFTTYTFLPDSGIPVKSNRFYHIFGDKYGVYLDAVAGQGSLPI